MPYRRRYNRKPRRRPRRNLRRLRRRKTAMIKRNTGISGRAGTHVVRQKVYTNFTIPATATTPGPHFVKKTFQLIDLPQALTFRQLYDEYRINAVSVKIILNSNTDTTISQNLQLAYVLNDKDDDVTPISWPVFMERAGVRMKNLFPNAGGGQATMYTKPTPLTMLYNSPTSTGYALTKRAPYIDMGNPSLPHFGLLFGFNNGQEIRNSTQQVTMITTYYMSFRGLK